MPTFINDGQDYALSSVDQGIYEESSTQKAPLGTKKVLPDGRVFRYGYVGGSTLAAGILVGPDVSATCQAETDNIAAAAAIGATTVDLTIASVTANQFQGGYLHTSDDTGEAYTYRIKSNDATGGAGGTGVTRLTLYDPLVVAIDTTTDIAITGCLWNQLVIFDATGGTDFLVSGVTPRTFTANYYGWFQTAGVATVLNDGGSTTIGDMLTASDGIDGAVQLQDAYTEQVVGSALYTADDTGYVGVLLNILP